MLNVMETIKNIHCCRYHMTTHNLTYTMFIMTETTNVLTISFLMNNIYLNYAVYFSLSMVDALQRALYVF